MADKVTTPATEQIDATAPSELEQAKAALAKAQNDAQNLRAQFNRNLSLKDQQIQQLQTQHQTPMPEYGEEDDSAALRQLREQYQRDRQAATQRELRRDEELFYLRNPAAEAKKDEIAALFSDPQMAADLAVIGADGTPDAMKSMKNAWREIRLRQLEKVEQKSAEAKAGQSAETERQKLQATISGTGASEAPEALDLSKMTNDEIIKSGALEGLMDPNDPLKTKARKNAPG